jgi:hypothetical protein
MPRIGRVRKRFTGNVENQASGAAESLRQSDKRTRFEPVGKMPGALALDRCQLHVPSSTNCPLAAIAPSDFQHAIRL